MMIDLVKTGPLAVGIEVGEDFMHYKNGIYHKINSSLKSKFDPLEVSNVRTILRDLHSIHF